MDLNKDYLQDLFIDEVKGCLGSDGGGGKPIKKPKKQ